MRIALFTETFLPKIDGIVTRLRNTIAQLQQMGHQVLVFAPGDGPGQYAGARVEGMHGSHFPLYPELTLSLPRASIRHKLIEFRPDLIHVADPACLGVAGIYYSDVLHVPLVISYHTRLPKYLRYYGLSALEPAVWRLMKVRHNKAQLNLCTSPAMADELQAHGVERVRLWPKAVDTDCFHPRFESAEMRKQLSEGHPEDPLILYVGRLSPEKRIGSIRPALRAIPRLRLAIVGGGPMEAALRSHFSGLPVHFAGYLTGEALASAMASADALVLPSKTETLGLVLMEAMAAGSVVVGADAGGIPDVIQHQVSGLLYDADCDSSLVDSLQSVISDDRLRSNLKREARTRAQHWSWAAATGRLLTCYEEAIDMPFRSKPKRASAPWMLAVKRAAIGGIKVFLP